MSVFFAPVGGFETRTITFDGTSWNSKLIEEPLGYSYDTILEKTKIKKIVPKQSYEQIITKLENIGLFTLRNQSELNITNRVFDGALYSISYKVGNKFRQLTFDNPKIYKKYNRNKKEFRRYIRLIKIFENSFNTS
jgi:hypothetical protein